MNGPNELATNENDDELCEGWFEQGELMAFSEAPPQGEASTRRSRVGMIIAAISATALALVLVFASHV